jgi:hypothetical protein
MDQGNVMETEFGAPLNFEALPVRRPGRIAAYGEGDVTEEDRFGEMSAWFIDALTRLRAAIEARMESAE